MQSHWNSFGKPSLSSPTHLEGSQEAQRSVLERPQCASKGPMDSPREPNDAPRPSKLQPRCLKKATKMQFAMHFLNVVHQNGVSNSFPKSLLRFLAVRTLTIVWQGQHIQHFCDFQVFQQLYPQNHHFSSGFQPKLLENT